MGYRVELLGISDFLLVHYTNSNSNSNSFLILVLTPILILIMLGTRLFEFSVNGARASVDTTFITTASSKV